MKDTRVYVLFAIAAAALVGGTVVATVLSPGWGAHWMHWGNGCTLSPPAGMAPLAAREAGIEVGTEGGRYTAVRTLTFAGPSAAEQARVVACTDTGSVTLVAGSGTTYQVEVKVYGYASTEAEARSLAARLNPVVQAKADALYAWEPRSDLRAVGLGIRVMVPSATLVDATLTADTGSATADGVRLGKLLATTDTGSIDLTPSWAQGELHATADTGAVQARFANLGAATLQFTTDTGGIEVDVPADARHGYDVRATVDTGGITFDLPGLRDAEPSSRTHRHAQTEGYDGREVKVRMTLTADTGGIEVGST